MFEDHRNLDSMVITYAGGQWHVSRAWEICRHGVNVSQAASIMYAVLCLNLLVWKLEVSRLRRNLTRGLFLEPQLSASSSQIFIIGAPSD